MSEDRSPETEESGKVEDQEKPPIDNPIRSSTEDVLDRATIAHDFAKSIRNLDASEGVVIGILGAWGHGKSSFINLMKEEFEKEPALAVLDFNPWMFSGSQQLVDFFFKEIASELRLKNKDRFGGIADGLDAYGDVLSPIAIVPFFGAWWDRSYKALRAAAKWAENRRKGTKSLRDKIADALRDLDQPIVVVIDDIDRLSTDEIRDIFKLVRLTASFPNLVYVLAFDRKRVEQALDETNVPGRAYLEKIVQLSFDLPAIPREMLRKEIFSSLNRILGDIPGNRFDESRWPDVFVEIVEPLFGNLRDVTRLGLSARPTLEALGTQVEVVDLIALESLRVFRPELFALLAKMRSVLTQVSNDYGSRDDDPKVQAQVDELIECAGQESSLVRDLISRVFPAARRYLENYNHDYSSMAEWRREHRVAHIDFLNLYFDRTAPSELAAFRQAETAYSLLPDADGFGAFLDAIKPSELEETIKALEAYEHSYPLDGIVPGSINLMNRIAQIPEREYEGMFDFNRPDITVGRVVLRMFRMLEDESEREKAALAILPELRSYSTRLDFIHSMGYKDGVGHKLVSEKLATEFEQSLVEAVTSTDSPEPDSEWDLLRVYYFVADHKGEDYTPPSITNTDLLRSLFKSARSVNRSQSFDSRTVKKEVVLAWEPLLKILGSEDAIRQSLELLRVKDGETELVGLVDKYLSGWRPSRD